MDAVDTFYANTRNNPVEDIESHLPLRVARYELREGAMGAGRWRGGLGSVREFLFVNDGGDSIEGDGHRFLPWGIFGGSDGVAAKLQHSEQQPFGSFPPRSRIRASVPETASCVGALGAVVMVIPWTGTPKRCAPTSSMA
jgi:N-methylhydantoinase B